MTCETSMAVEESKMAKENSIATAGVLGGVAGLLLGGFWPFDCFSTSWNLGGAGFRIALSL